MSSLPPLPNTSPTKRTRVITGSTSSFAAASADVQPNSSPNPTSAIDAGAPSSAIDAAFLNANKAEHTDNRPLEDILMENQPAKLVHELKRQVKYRDQIINSLRKGYLKDVILLKEQIIVRDQRDALERSRQQSAAAPTPTTTPTKKPTTPHKIGGLPAPPPHSQPQIPTTFSSSKLAHPKPALSATYLSHNVPSIDFEACLPFFIPNQPEPPVNGKTHELMFKSCHVCAGNVSLRLIRNDDEIKRLLNNQARRLNKASDAAMALKEKEIETLTQASKLMSTQLIEAMKQETHHKNIFRHDRNIAFQQVGVLRKTRTYDALEHEYERLERHTTLERTSLEKDNKEKSKEIERLEEQKKEAFRVTDELTLEVSSACVTCEGAPFNVLISLDYF